MLMSRVFRRLQNNFSTVIDKSRALDMGDFNIRRHRYSCMVLSTITDKTTIKSSDLVLIFSQDVQNTSVQKCEFLQMQRDSRNDQGEGYR